METRPWGLLLLIAAVGCSTPTTPEPSSFAGETVESPQVVVQHPIEQEAIAPTPVREWEVIADLAPSDGVNSQAMIDFSPSSRFVAIAWAFDGFGKAQGTPRVFYERGTQRIDIPIDTWSGYYLSPGLLPGRLTAVYQGAWRVQVVESATWEHGIDKRIPLPTLSDTDLKRGRDRIAFWADQGYKQKPGEGPGGDLGQSTGNGLEWHCVNGHTGQRWHTGMRCPECGARVTPPRFGYSGGGVGRPNEYGPGDR